MRAHNVRSWQEEIDEDKAAIARLVGETDWQPVPPVFGVSARNTLDTRVIPQAGLDGGCQRSPLEQCYGSLLEGDGINLAAALRLGLGGLTRLL